MESNTRDALETMLDDALRSYSQAEPLAGLEERILNRTRPLRVNRGAGYLRKLAFTGLAAALCVPVFFLMRFRQLPTPKISVVAVNGNHSVASLPSLKLPVSSATGLISKRQRRPVRQLLAKQEQFPMAEPPTAEERALVRFVDRDPKEALEDFASLQRNSDAPIVIQPLQITPLQADGPGN